MPFETPEWMEHGRCQTVTPKEKATLYSDKASERIDAAKKICGDCPVKLECLRFALDNKEVHGVWGGCDELELRRALWVEGPSSRQRLKFPRCPACNELVGSLRVVPGTGLGRKGAERVECVSCSFSWSAPTSINAVKLFWQQAEYLRRQKETASVTVRVPKGRIPRSGAPQRRRQPSALQSGAGAPDGARTALAASAAPR